MSAADFAWACRPSRFVRRGGAHFRHGARSALAGSTTVLLMQMAGGALTRAPAAPIPRLVRGGLGAFSAALAAAARSAGAEIRVNADVARITVKDAHVTGVTLTSGDELRARFVVSNADPRRTLLGLVDPVELEPSFLSRMRAYRCAGTVVKINLALSALPAFTALSAASSARVLGGRIHIGPDLDYLERAFDASKYGACSSRPYLDVTIPSVTDPDLAPAGGHVMSICAQFAPADPRGIDWSAAGPAFADTVIDTLAQYAPNLRSVILHRQVLTPRELDSTYGLTGGHIFHGELSLDQLFTMRQLLGWARYRTPIGPLPLRAARIPVTASRDCRMEREPWILGSPLIARVLRSPSRCPPRHVAGAVDHNASPAVPPRSV